MQKKKGKLSNNTIAVFLVIFIIILIFNDIMIYNKVTGRTTAVGTVKLTILPRVSIRTHKYEYKQNQVVIITGEGWGNKSIVELTILYPDSSIASKWNTTASSKGKIEDNWHIAGNALLGIYNLTGIRADKQYDNATTTFKVVEEYVPPRIKPPKPPVPRPCIEAWQCGPWGLCSPEGLQYRECWDLNKCLTEKAKPAVEQNCTYEWPPKPAPPKLIGTYYRPEKLVPLEPCWICYFLYAISAGIIVFVIITKYMQKKKKKIRLNPPENYP